MSMLGPIDLSLLSGGMFREYSDIQPFSYRAGMTYAHELEALRTWTFRTLVPFLNENFSDMQDSWEVNVHRLTDAINAGLAAQTADNGQKIADALTAIAEADIPITDPGVLAVLNSPTTGTRGWLDARYQQKGDYQPAGAYLTPTSNAQSTVTGWWHVDDFGAKGDGATLDHVAIQAAIDAASTRYASTGLVQHVYFAAKTYAVGVVDYHKADGSVYGVTSLMLKDGVELFGDGTIRSADGGYGVGALYSIVRSIDTGVSNAGIRGLTFDGNKANHTASGQAGCITIDGLANVWVIGTHVMNANGNGIMVKGSTSRFVTAVRIENNNVSDAAYIGIQCAQFDGLMILNNHVTNAANNGIDIYGEDGTSSTHGINFTISGNRVKGCATGVFLETVSRGLTIGNRIQNSAGGEGVHVNRINGQPNRLLISDNHIAGGVTGVAVSGDTGGVTIRNNEFEDFNYAGVKLGAAGTVSNVWILNNTMNGNADATPKVLIPADTTQTVGIVHRGTVTLSKNRSADTINLGPAVIGSTWTPALSPGDAITNQ